ncbi:hypothetical protein OPT61_g9972 [Boeremia exigua]|uniref:Uncharacterized protein n=1 Tax=Boeremia exigua TaxID=749465 RepID=A0ACC2HRT1_9PLEO|nr:hypothetical protein OPT61_g9972 [Boeremia exigua]
MPFKALKTTTNPCFLDSLHLRSSPWHATASGDFGGTQRLARHRWTEKERRYTILTVYHSSEAVRDHYENHDTQYPALATLFPDEPYTLAAAIEARSHGLTPNDLAALNVRRVLPIHKPPVPGEGGVPYKHWPTPPWPVEPDLPLIGAGVVPMANRDRFMDTKPHLSNGDESQWHGAKYLGNGSSGAAGLWCRIDEHGNVIDRMVVKDNAVCSREGWRDPKNWRDGLPREIAINRRIEARRVIEPDAFRYIIRYRGHRLLMWKRRFRLYTDFASGGDLANAMDPYDRKWSRIKPHRIGTQDCIPEAFIWYTIKALATSFLALETGTLGTGTVKGWKAIVHLDVQTPNILLDVQSKKRKAPADEATDPAEAGPSKRPKNEATEPAKAGPSKRPRHEVSSTAEPLGTPANTPRTKKSSPN